jgi:hypothetical protein
MQPDSLARQFSATPSAFDYNGQNGNVVNIAAEGGKLELLLQHCMLAGRRAVFAP